MQNLEQRWGAALLACALSGCPGGSGGGTESSSTTTSGTTDDDTGSDTTTGTSGDTIGTTDDTATPTGSTTTAGGTAACRDEPDAPIFQHESGDVGTETWAAGMHVLAGGINVTGLLTVEPCSVIQVPDGAAIVVSDGGALHWVGTAEDPIIVTSSRPTGTPGDWVEIDIRATSVGPDNVFRHVVIEYGGGGTYGALWVEPGASIEVSDSVIRHSGDVGVVAEGYAALRNFVGNTLQDNAKGAVRIDPNGAGSLGVGTYAPNAVDGILLTAGAVTQSQTWLAHDAPYVATFGFSVETEAGSAQLTVDPGATIQMGSGSILQVGNNGGLTMVGTADKPITLTSSKSSGAPGDWLEIDVFSASADDLNRLDHVVIEHAGGGGYGQVWVEDGASIAIRNTTIRNGDDVGVENHGELREFAGNTLVDNAAGALRIDANAVDQLHTGIYGPNGVDGVLVLTDTIDHDATWEALGVPFIAGNGFAIATDAGSARLSFDPGSELRLGEGSILSVDLNGALRLDGTADAPVRITSAKPAPAGGDWLEIDLNEGSVGPENVFTHAEISYGGGSLYGQLWLADGAEVNLDHVTFSEAGNGCDIAGTGLINAMSTSFVPCP